MVTKKQGFQADRQFAADIHVVHIREGPHRHERRGDRLSLHVERTYRDSPSDGHKPRYWAFESGVAHSIWRPFLCCRILQFRLLQASVAGIPVRFYLHHRRDASFSLAELGRQQDGSSRHGWKIHGAIRACMGAGVFRRTVHGPGALRACWRQACRLLGTVAIFGLVSGASFLRLRNVEVLGA